MNFQWFHDDSVMPRLEPATAEVSEGERIGMGNTVRVWALQRDPRGHVNIQRACYRQNHLGHVLTLSTKASRDCDEEEPEPHWSHGGLDPTNQRRVPGMAEEEGFEPRNPFSRSTVFKTAGFNHSPIPPSS